MGYYSLKYGRSSEGYCRYDSRSEWLTRPWLVHYLSLLCKPRCQACRRLLTLKTNPRSGSPTLFWVWTWNGGGLNLVIFVPKPINNHINKKRSRRELSIDKVIHRDIFKNNQITLLPCVNNFVPKTEVSCYCATKSTWHRINRVSVQLAEPGLQDGHQAEYLAYARAHAKRYLFFSKCIPHSSHRITSI